MCNCTCACKCLKNKKGWIIFSGRLFKWRWTSHIWWNILFFLLIVRSTTVFFQHSETFIASSLVAMCSACCPTIFLYQELQSNISTACKKQSNDWFIDRILIVLMFLLGFYVKHFPRDQIAQQWLVPGISNRTRRRGVLFERCCGEIWICRGCCMANKSSDKDKNGSTNFGMS